MAFDFLGTLSIPQLQELRSFLEIQILDIDDEINYLKVELDNFQQVLAKMSEADFSFEGNAVKVLYDTKLHNVVKKAKLNDSHAADLMEQVKRPFVSTIKYKHERLEYKMKKLLDIVEQIKESIDRKAIAKSQTRALLNQLETLFTKSNQANLFKTEEQMQNFFQGIPI